MNKGKLLLLDRLTKELLIRLYQTEKKSAREISVLLHCKKETVRKYLDFYDIPRRSFKEAILNKIATDAEYREQLYRRQRERPVIHDRALQEELANLETQGFKCIPIGMLGFPKPDIVAIKDGKIYAIEVELSCANYSKYKDLKCFDDIIWIVRRKDRGKR